MKMLPGRGKSEIWAGTVWFDVSYKNSNNHYVIKGRKRVLNIRRGSLQFYIFRIFQKICVIALKLKKN